MMLLRRIGASLAVLALTTTTLVALLPCGMRAGESHTPASGIARAHGEASASHSHHHAQQHAPADETASRVPDESGAPVSSCPVMGPCALHLLGTSPQSAGARSPGGAMVAVTPSLAPPSRTLAPELPPPRA